MMFLFEIFDYPLKRKTDTVSKYITGLFNTIKELKGEDVTVNDDPMQTDETPAATADDTPTTDKEEFPPVHQEGEDMELAGNLKQEAADLKANGDWEGALDKYTQAVLAAPPSALLYANRANALIKLGRFKAAERDCDLALEMNPDSAKALRMRGKARKELGKYELALKDLSESQKIDFDESVVEDLKVLSEKHIEAEKAEALKRIEEEDQLRKRAEEIRKAQEEAKREAEEEEQNRAGGFGVGGMPGGFSGGMPGGMPGGMGDMPGMPNMAEMMQDPDIAAGMSNPKIMAAFQELMSGPGGPMGILSNPAKLQQMMADPEVGPFLQKLMGKFAGGGGMGGVPGGFGGAGPGAANSGAQAADDDDEDIPDLPDLTEVD